MGGRGGIWVADLGSVGEPLHQSSTGPAGGREVMWSGTPVFILAHSCLSSAFGFKSRFKTTLEATQGQI